MNENIDFHSLPLILSLSLFLTFSLSLSLRTSMRTSRPWESTSPYPAQRACLPLTSWVHKHTPINTHTKRTHTPAHQCLTLYTLSFFLRPHASLFRFASHTTRKRTVVTRSRIGVTRIFTSGFPLRSNVTIPHDFFHFKRVFPRNERDTDGWKDCLCRRWLGYVPCRAY